MRLLERLAMRLGSWRRRDVKSYAAIGGPSYDPIGDKADRKSYELGSPPGVTISELGGKSGQI